MTTDYEHYPNLQALLADMARGVMLYQAPLDARPYTIAIRRYHVNFQKPELSTFTFWSSETGVLTRPIEQHFDRFVRRTA